MSIETVHSIMNGELTAVFVDSRLEDVRIAGSWLEPAREDTLAGVLVELINDGLDRHELDLREAETVPSELDELAAPLAAFAAEAQKRLQAWIDESPSRRRAVEEARKGSPGTDERTVHHELLSTTWRGAQLADLRLSRELLDSTPSEVGRAVVRAIGSDIDSFEAPADPAESATQLDPREIEHQMRAVGARLAARTRGPF